MHACIPTSSMGSSAACVLPIAASCVTKGQVLRNGDCSEFVQYFVDNPACSAGDAAFKGVVNGSPTPDATWVPSS